MEKVGDSYRLSEVRAAARRGNVLHAIESAPERVSDADLCRRAIAAIVSADEAPFAMVYLVDGSRGARLAATVGIEAGTRWTPRFLGPDSAEAWPVDHVVATGESVELGQLEARFGARPAGLAREIRGARLVAIRSRATESVRGVLVVGLGAGEPGSFLRAAAERLGAALTRAAERVEAERVPVLPVF